MSQKPVSRTDLQFSDPDATSAKLRRLVTDLQAVEAAVNTLINSVTTLQAPASATVTATGLEQPLTISGGQANQVLQALTATSAAFAGLNLEQLLDVAVSGAASGQVLTFSQGRWVNAAVPTVAAPVISGENLGNLAVNAPLYAGLDGAKLAFRSLIGDGTSIQLTYTADTIEIAFIGAAVTGAAGPSGPPGQDGENGGEDFWSYPPGAPAAALIAVEAAALTDGAQVLTLPRPVAGWFMLCVNGLRQAMTAYSVSANTVSVPATLNVQAGDLLSFDFYPAP